MKRFVFFTLAIVLALGVGPMIYHSSAQEESIEPDSMEGTTWAVYTFAFDSGTGEFLYWFEDTYEFSGGIFCVFGLDCAPYSEFQIGGTTIWRSLIEQELNWWDFRGIRPASNPKRIAGKIDSNVGLYFKFFGYQISVAGERATPENYGAGGE